MKFFVFLAVVLLSGNSAAYGDFQLPPGQLKRAVNNLPTQAKTRALQRLQGMAFPVEDAAFLRVNGRGDVYYAEPPIIGGYNSTLVVATDPEKVFKLHSNPGSQNVIYLDFDGMVLENNVHNYYYDERLVALPYDPSENDVGGVANFTQYEMNQIAEIWHRVAEDFAPFDVDVTTEVPAEFGPTVGSVLITTDTDRDGKEMPGQGWGGLAYVGVFGLSNYGDYYSPALVYYTNVGMVANNVAEVASHEFGHNLGLSHDGQPGVSYYRGHGEEWVSWAPIMGNSYSANVTQWSKGEYENANNTEDDLSIIGDKLGYLADDHGNTASSATPIVVGNGGTIFVTSPEHDPDNVLTENKGVINSAFDVDWFYIDITESAWLNLDIYPAWHSFKRNDDRGANLDLGVAVYDESLNEIAYIDLAYDTLAPVWVNVTPGRYYIAIDGVGNNTYSDYTDYNSAGMYFIQGEIGNEPPQPVSIELSYTADKSSKGRYLITITWTGATTETVLFTYPSGTTREMTNNGGLVMYLKKRDAGGEYTVCDTIGNCSNTITLDF